MAHYLCIQSTYTSVEVALFQEQKLLSFAHESKVRTSKHLIPLIAYALAHAGVALDELSFIAVNQGPGPFTNLRVAIATANGIAFARTLPLVGVDALDTFLKEHSSSDLQQSNLILFNAFNNEVYFAWKTGESTEKGYENIDKLLARIKENGRANSILCLGNGATLYAEKIKASLGEKAILPDPMPIQSSIEKIAFAALEQWQNKENISQQLSPLYLKKAI